MKIKEDEGGMTTSVVPANRTGSSVVGTGDDPVTWRGKKSLRTILTPKPLTRRMPKGV
jgi:hypothetical protein